MKSYTVRPEYLTAWGHETTEDTIITEAELNRLAREWDTPVESLLDQLIEADDIPCRVSIDNGATWTTPAEALRTVTLSTMTAYMYDDICEQVARELAPCTDEAFLTRYLELSPTDLVIG